MSIVQAFGREDQEMDKFKEINDRHRKANIESIFLRPVLSNHRGP